jgi:hypothetical protein
MPDGDGGASRSYYRDRAICRKIMKEGTGLCVEYMPTSVLSARLSAHASLLKRYIEDQGLAQPAVVRAAWELEEIAGEVFLRGHQLQLFDD